MPKTDKERAMRRTYVKAALAGAVLLGMATAALAVTGEYDNMCTMGLAMGKEVATDCSINAQIGGRTYCFGSQEAMAEFMKDPDANLAKAQAYYSKKKPG
jgi:YHS domain-containing protein